MKLKMLDVGKIQPNPLQPRETFERESIQELANSIKEANLLQPILVAQKGKIFEIVAGERRWRAFKISGKKKIPSIIWDVKDDIDALEKGVIENLQREDLTSVERENAIYTLWKSGRYKSISELAKKLGIVHSTIISLIEAKEFRDKEGFPGDISTRIIKHTRGLPREERKRIIEKVKAGHIRAIDVEEAARFVKTAKEPVKEAFLKTTADLETLKPITELKKEEQQREAIQIVREEKLAPEGVREVVENLKRGERPIARSLTGGRIGTEEWYLETTDCLNKLNTNLDFFPTFSKQLKPEDQENLIDLLIMVKKRLDVILTKIKR